MSVAIRNLPWDWSAFVLWAGAVLAIAYGIEQVLALEPCVLCQRQRLVWWAALALGLCALRWRHEGWRVAGIAVMLASVVLALYHAGGERGLWTLAWFCGGLDFSRDISPEALALLLAERDPASCDSPSWVLFSLSLAEYNALASLSGLVLLCYARARSKRA